MFDEIWSEDPCIIEVLIVLYHTWDHLIACTQIDSKGFYVPQKTIKLDKDIMALN